MRIFTRQRVRHQSSAQWLAENPVLVTGEEGWDTDLDAMKVGDGVTPWTALAFRTPIVSVATPAVAPKDSVWIKPL